MGNDWNERIGKFSDGSPVTLYPSGKQGGTYNLGKLRPTYKQSGYAVYPDGTTGPTGGGVNDFTETKQTKYSGKQPGYISAPSAFNIPDRPDMPQFNAPTLENAPEFEAPEMPNTPAFVMPGYDQEEITRLQSKAAAPGIRNLRELYGVVRSAARRGDPQSRQTLKDALKGYGSSLSENQARARDEASQEYATKYAQTYDAATKNWQTQVENSRSKYESDFKGAENNWQQAIQHVRDKYTGQMEARKSEFQAEVDAVNMVYKSEVAAEKTRYEGEIKTSIANYDSAWKGYLATGTTTTTRSYS